MWDFRQLTTERESSKSSNSLHNRINDTRCDLNCHSNFGRKILGELAIFMQAILVYYTKTNKK